MLQEATRPRQRGGLDVFTVAFTSNWYYAGHVAQFSLLRGDDGTGLYNRLVFGRTQKKKKVKNLQYLTNSLRE
jgi:hypothetical protein